MDKEKKHKRRRFDNQTIQLALPPLIDGEIFSEEGDTSMYVNLLRALETRHDVPNCRTRHNNEGSTYDSNDDCAKFESASGSEEEVSENDSEYSLENEGGDNSHLHNETIPERWSEETADVNEIPYQDDVYDSITDDVTFSDETTEMRCSSSFNHHFGHVLANENAEKLKKQKLKFKWAMPAKEMAMSTLVGTGKDLSMELNQDPFYGINRNLYNHWKNISVSSNSGDSCSAKRRFFFSLCNTYRDIMYCEKKPFYLKGKQDDSIIMDAYIMHALNHIQRSRDFVLKNDAELKKNESRREELLHSDIYLDHGFTRPKVMLLLPYASIAFRVVNRLVQLSPLSQKGNVAYMDRFNEEFGPGDYGGDKTDGSLEIQNSRKPIDFQTLFGGNNDDHFMMGIKFTKKCIKLYSNFYSSDIIVASPLGLITKIVDAEAEKEKDVDYLSSIEVMIIDHADIITMQNFSHVNTVIEHLNCMPSKQHGTDMMRIKKWYLEGYAPFYRQTIFLGSYITPDMKVLFDRFCFNYEGKVKLISKHKGVLNKVLHQVCQVYDRFEASSVSNDTRLEYFSKKVFPKIKDSPKGGTLLFVSSHFEFVRLRLFLKSQDASFCNLSEYTRQSDISRARLWFFEGKRKILLYTERAHFYHRYKIRGIKNLIIYSLPERKEFYPEIVNMVEGSQNMLCTVLFSKLDRFRLERIVGNSAAKKMVSSDKATFVFC